MLASPRISGQREHHGEIVATAEWPAIISPAETARDPRAARRTRSGARTRAARRYLLGGLLVCSHCGERLVARPRSGGQRRYACAKGPGFSGCGKTYINADDGRAVRRRGRAAPARLAPSCSAALERRQRSDPDAQRWLRRDRAGAGAARSSSPPPTATARSRWTSWRAARKPIEQRLTDARKQLAQGLAHQRARPLRRQRRGAARASGTRSTSASSTRSSPPSLDHVVVGPGRRGYNRFDESRLTPRLAALSKQLRDLRERERIGRA